LEDYLIKPKIKVELYKKTKTALLYTSDYIDDANKIEKTISLFDSEYLYTRFLLEKDTFLPADYFDKNEDAEVVYTESKRKYKTIFICVAKELVKKFVGLEKIFDDALEGYAGKKDEINFFLTNDKLKEYDAQFLFAYEKGTTIRFSTEKYDCDSIVTSIKDVVI